MTGLRWGAATDVGRLRRVNEDSVLTATPLFAVADGMGGHAGGEVASDVALTTLDERFAAEPHTTQALVQAVRDANTAIYERALAQANLHGMGTTLTGVALVERDGHERLAVVNVGDSRTYVLQDGILQQITRDHTYVEDLVMAGEITADEARVHPQRHIVTRALGIEPDVQVDAWEAPPGAGDRYLICSDGLFNEIDDGQISAVLTGTTDPQEAADTLVELANEAGGRDNITVIVLDVTGDTPPLTDREAEPVVVDLPDTDPTTDPPTGQFPAPVVATPVGLASPDGTPPVGGWLDDDPAPTTATPVPPPVSPPEPPPPPTAEPRRHRVTVRSVLFVVAVLAILGIAFGGITFYGRSGYYVGFVGDQVAVYKGQKGGDALGGSHPRWHLPAAPRPAHAGVAAEPRPHHQLHVARRRRRLVRHLALQPRRRHPARHHHRSPTTSTVAVDTTTTARGHGAQRTVIASARRSTELGLVLMAALVTTGAYALVALGRTATLPANLLPFLAVILGLLLAAHLATRRLAPGADGVLLPIAALLNGVGYVFIARIDTNLAGLQANWTFLAIAAYVVTLLLVRRVHDLARYKWTFAFVGVALLLLPFVPSVGKIVNGSRIWVGIGPINFQPGEFAKIALALFFAAYLVERRELLAMATWRVGPLWLPEPRHLGPVLIAWVASLVVLIGQKDLGSALLFFTLFVVMLWIATERASYLAIGTVLFAGRRLRRLARWRTPSAPACRSGSNPWADSLGKGFQLVQAAFAFAWGGVSGTGLALGDPTRIPEVKNDFIFAAIGEELGLLGTTAIIISYLLMIGAGLRIANRTERPFEKLLAAGLTTIIGVQAFVIIAGVTRVLPLTGVTLPFVSYGGSSLLANYILLAILMRISDDGASAWARCHPASRPGANGAGPRRSDATSVIEVSP